MDEYIDFPIDNKDAVEFLGDLVEHLKQTGKPLQVNTSRGIVDLGVEGRICVTFAYDPDNDGGRSMALDIVDDQAEKIESRRSGPLWRDVELSITFYHREARNAMTNEELAVLIQGGERDKLVELWAQVERFVAQQAHRRLVLSAGLGGVEFGDLYNAGYLALVAAVDSFDPGAGGSFIGWLALALKTAFAEAGGYRSRKQSLDPLHRAGSLESPVGDDEDSATLGELIPDPAAEAAMLDVEERQRQERLHAALRGMIATLPPELQAAIWGRYYRGEIVDANAHSKALRMLRAPKYSRTMRVYL